MQCSEHLSTVNTPLPLLTSIIQLYMQCLHCKHSKLYTSSPVAMRRVPPRLSDWKLGHGSPDTHVLLGHGSRSAEPMKTQVPPSSANLGSSALSSSSDRCFPEQATLKHWQPGLHETGLGLRDTALPGVCHKTTKPAKFGRFPWGGSGQRHKSCQGLWNQGDNGEWLCLAWCAVLVTMCIGKTSSLSSADWTLQRKKAFPRQLWKCT